jgi:hypothetical protein
MRSSAPLDLCPRPPTGKGSSKASVPLLGVLDHALHQVPQGTTVDRALGARPPAGVRAPSRAIGAYGDPAVVMHQPPDDQVRVCGGPARTRPISTQGPLPGSPWSHRRISCARPQDPRRWIRGRDRAPAPTSMLTHDSSLLRSSGTWRHSPARGPSNTDNSVGHDGEGVLLLIWMGLVVIADRAEGSPRI